MGSEMCIRDRLETEPHQFRQPLNTTVQSPVISVPRVAAKPVETKVIPGLSEVNEFDDEFSSSKESGDSVASDTNDMGSDSGSDSANDFQSNGPAADRLGLDDTEGPSPLLRANLDGEAVWWRQYVQRPIHAPNSPVGVNSNSLAVSYTHLTLPTILLV